MDQKKVLLIGGSGFIGRNLAEQLRDRCQIFAPTHRELDLLNQEQVERFFASVKFDVIIYAANVGGKRDQAGLLDVFKNNRQMFLNVAAQSDHYGWLIFFGSGAEYGKQQPIVKATENDFGKVLPQDEYGRAKFAASEYIAQHEHIMNLRCFGVFGKYEDYATRFISNVICLSLAGRPIVVRQNVVFDYIYVNDLIKIVAYFLQHEPKQKFYNAGRGQGIELLSLAKIVKELTHNPYDIRILQPGLGKEYTCDNSRLLRELGEFHFTPIEQAVRELIDWYKHNWAGIDQAKLTRNL